MQDTPFLLYVTVSALELESLKDISLHYGPFHVYCNNRFLVTNFFPLATDNHYFNPF